MDLVDFFLDYLFTFSKPKFFIFYFLKMGKDTIDIKEFQQMKHSIEFLSNMFEKQKEAITRLEQEKELRDKEIKLLKEENRIIKSELKILSQKDIEKDIKKLSPNLEIIGLPESKDENLTTMVQNLHQKIGIEFDSNKIRNIYRTKTRKNGQKNVVIETDSKETRDKILEKMKKEKIKINSFDIAKTTVKSYIFINEHVPFKVKKLFNEIKTVKNDFNIKYVWIKNGHILTRKDENSEVKWIKELEELTKKN